MSVVHLENFLEDRWQRGSGPESLLVNPATEVVVADATTGGLDLGRALAFARDTGGAALRGLSFGERGALLERMSTALHQSRERMIDSAIENGGCTRSDAKFDVDGAIFALASYAELGKQLGERKILADGEGTALGRSPRLWGQHFYLPRRGVAVLINAFNFPVWGFAEKAACALLAGMPVLVKPATSTALTAFYATQALLEHAKLPAGVFGLLAGPAKDLLEHLQTQDVLAFTGSAHTAQSLRAHPSVIKNSVRINVEADSLNASVLGPDVAEDSEVFRMFIRDVSKEMTQKSGQKCTAVRRILVPEDKISAVTESLKESFAEIIIGNPADKDVRMGPLTTKSQLADVRAGVQFLREEAEVVLGDPDGKVSPRGVAEGTGYFHPILLLKVRDANTAHRVHACEVFGPVATLIPYSGDAASASALVQKGEGGLVTSLFSDDRAFIEHMVLEIAPYHGRIYLAGEKLIDQAPGSGLVFPQCIHGGPGRAGGGEELGGLRGLSLFMQRTAFMGPRATVEKLINR